MGPIIRQSSAHFKRLLLQLRGQGLRFALKRDIGDAATFGWGGLRIRRWEDRFGSDGSRFVKNVSPSHVHPTTEAAERGDCCLVATKERARL